MLRGRTCILLIVLAALAAAPAYSTTVDWFTDPVLWAAAVSGLYSINFDSAVPDGQNYIDSYSNPAFSFTDSGNVVDFTNMWGTANQLTTIGKPGAYGFPTDFGSGAYLKGMVNQLSTALLRVQLSPGKLAVGANLATGSYSPTLGKDVDVKLYASGQLVDDKTITTSSSAAWTFLGFISDTPITYMEIRSVAPGYTDVFPYMDNFSYGDPADTPDLDTLVLCGTGFALLSFAARLRRRFRH